MIKKPVLDLKNVFAGLLISIGIILFLNVIHILTIESTGDTADVLETVFIVALRVAETIGIIAIALLIIQILSIYGRVSGCSKKFS